MYAADVPLTDIAQMLARVRGREMRLSVVKFALLNPVYLGKVVIWGVGRRRKPTIHDTPEYVGPGRHERLVDDETWQNCQERHRRDARTPARRRNPSNPLSGIVRCAHCDKLMQLHKANKRDPADRLECPRLSSQTCAGPGTPRLDEMLGAVLDAVREHVRYLRADPVAQAESAGRAARAGADVARLRRELDDTRAAMAKLASGWASGKVPDAAYEAAMAPLQAAERELDDRLQLAATGARQLEPAAVALLGERMLAAWPKMTVPERNRALKTLVKQVTIRRSVYWREPVALRVAIDFW